MSNSEPRNWEEFLGSKSNNDDTFTDLQQDIDNNKKRYWLKWVAGVVGAVILVVVCIGVVAILTSRKPNASSVNTNTLVNDTQSTTPTKPEEANTNKSAFQQCRAEAASNNPTPETSDNNFYPKIIAYYDAVLACYNQFPDAQDTTGKEKIADLREEAVEATKKEDEYDGQNNNSPATGDIGASDVPEYHQGDCDAYKNAAESLKNASDQKYALYQNAFAIRKNYEFFYDNAKSNYGVGEAKRLADTAYTEQQAELQRLMDEWKSVLDAQNNASAANQECLSSYY